MFEEIYKQILSCSRKMRPQIVLPEKGVKLIIGLIKNVQKNG